MLQTLFYLCPWGGSYGDSRSSARSLGAAPHDAGRIAAANRTQLFDDQRAEPGEDATHRILDPRFALYGAQLSGWRSHRTRRREEAGSPVGRSPSDTLLLL